jgi:hypothetical protein
MPFLDPGKLLNLIHPQQIPAVENQSVEQVSAMEPPLSNFRQTVYAGLLRLPELLNGQEVDLTKMGLFGGVMKGMMEKTLPVALSKASDDKVREILTTMRDEINTWLEVE